MDVEEFIGYLSDIEAWVRGALNQGKKGDELVAAVMPQLKEKYGKWNFFDYFAKSNIKDIAAELKGQKRLPVSVPPNPRSLSYRKYASVTYCCTIRCVLKNDPLMAMACSMTSR